MNGRLIKKEFCFLLRNPVVYIGAIFMVMIVFLYVRPYWNFYGNVRAEGEEVTYSVEGDLPDGFIPVEEEEVFQKAFAELQEYLVSECGITEQKAEEEVSKAQEWEIGEIVDYFKTKYKINGIRNLFQIYMFKTVNAEEMDAYLQENFGEGEKTTYTENLAYKYADYLGITSVLFTVLVFVLVLYRDMKKDIYALIHVKPMRAVTYLAGKMIAGVGTVLLFVIPLTFVMDLLTMKAGENYGLSVNFLDIWVKVLVFNVPSIIATGALVLLISLIFRSSIPAIPAVLLYYLYSNLGSADSVIGYHYKVRPLSLFVRFPDSFSMLEYPQGATFNQIFILCLATAAFAGSLWLWERRRDA